VLSVALLVAVIAALRGAWSPCGLSMLSSLNPMSERARGNRFAVTVGWYVFGAAIGGLLPGGVGAVVACGTSGLGASVRWGLAAVAALIALSSDAAPFGLHLPLHPRQVDERWLTAYRRWVYAAGYGVQIGAGVATYVMTAAVYLTVVLGGLTGSPLEALLVGVVFGIVRGLTLLVSGRARTPERLRALLARVERSGPLSLRAVMAAEAAVVPVAGFASGGLAGSIIAVAGVGALAVLAAASAPRRVSDRGPRGGGATRPPYDGPRAPTGAPAPAARTYR